MGSAGQWRRVRVPRNESHPAVVNAPREPIHCTVVCLAALSMPNTEKGNSLIIYFCTCDTGEAGKKPFGNGVNRIGRGFGHDPAAARSDIEAKEILGRC